MGSLPLPPHRKSPCATLTCVPALCGHSKGSLWFTPGIKSDLSTKVTHVHLPWWRASNELAVQTEAHRWAAGGRGTMAVKQSRLQTDTGHNNVSVNCLFARKIIFCVWISCPTHWGTIRGCRLKVCLLFRHHPAEEVIPQPLSCLHKITVQVEEVWPSGTGEIVQPGKSILNAMNNFKGK